LEVILIWGLILLPPAQGSMRSAIHSAWVFFFRANLVILQVARCGVVWSAL
jgi:hypothetical protein